MIRKANVADLIQIELIEKQFGADAFSRRSLRHFICSGTSYVVELGGKVVGYLIAIKRTNSSKVRLYSLIIDENYRGKGYAIELLQFLEIDVKLNLKDTITLEVRESNKAALALYYSFGFRKDKVIKEYYPDGESAIKMSKKI